jgi:hypothetical protein
MEQDILLFRQDTHFILIIKFFIRKAITLNWPIMVENGHPKAFSGVGLISFVRQVTR